MGFSIITKITEDVNRDRNDCTIKHLFHNYLSSRMLMNLPSIYNPGIYWNLLFCFSLLWTILFNKNTTSHTDMLCLLHEITAYSLKLGVTLFTVVILRNYLRSHIWKLSTSFIIWSYTDWDCTTWTYLQIRR